MITFFYTPMLCLMVLPVFAWSWRALFAVILVAGGCIAFYWTGLAFLSTRPLHIREIIGLYQPVMATIGFVVMVAGRSLGLLLQSRGSSRPGVLWADALGAAAIFALLIYPSHHMKRDSRQPPPQSCLASPLPVRIGNTGFRLPHTSILTIYFADYARVDWRSLNVRRLAMAKHHRDVCVRTVNGARDVAGIAISLRFRDGVRATSCQKPSLPWMRELCTMESEEIRQAFPESLWIFEPGPVPESRFGKLPPTYARYLDSREASAWKDGGSVLEAGGAVTRYADGFLVARGVRLANGDPLAAYCRSEPGRETNYCSVDHLLEDGLQVRWEFRGREGQVSDRLIEQGRRVRSVLRTIRAHRPGAD